MQKKAVAVLLSVLLSMGAGALLGYGPLLRYKSEGVLSMEMGTAEYKRFAELANDGNTVRQYAALTLSPDLSSDWVNELVASVVRGEWHKPVPKISKADAKELPDAMLQTEKGQAVYLGLRLTYTGSDPKDAATVTTWLGSYFKDVAARETVRDQVARWAAENRQFSDRATERKLKYQFEIEQAQSRSIALQKLVALYPEMSRREAQQVVEVRKDNEKFMSPMAQLVGAESDIIDVREKVKRLDREIEQQVFAKSMVADADVALNQSRSGSESIVKLSEMILRYNKLVKTEAERETLSSLAADVSQISARFLTQAQFVAQPSVPARPERPRPLMVIIFAGLLAGMLSGLFLWRKALLKMLGQNSRVNMQ